MKKLLVFSVLMLALTSSHAQISKGQWMIGGSGKVSFYEQDIFKGIQITLSPDVAYFLLNKLSGGVRLKLSKGSTKVSGSRMIKDTYYALQPFARYYIFPITKKMNPFVEAGYDFGRHTAQGTTDEKYNETLLGYSAAVGTAFFVHPKIALEVRLSYNYDNIANSTTKGTKTVNGDVGFQIHL